MTIIFNYPHPDGCSRQYNYNESEFRTNNNVPSEHIGAGFIITSKDQKKFYIGKVDGGHGFIDQYLSDQIQVCSNPTFLMDLVKTIDANVSINAVFIDPNCETQDIWFPLPFNIESDNSFHKNHLTERDEPLKPLNAKKEFPWEKTLVQDFSFLGKRYPIIKQHITEQLGEAWDFDTINAITRFYKGSAIDYVIYDLIQLAPSAESLDDIISYNLGSHNMRDYLLQAQENLKNNLPVPEHKFKDYIPLLKECIYTIILMIHDMSKILAKMIGHNMKFSAKAPYTAQMDGPLAAIVTDFDELRGTRIESEPAFKQLVPIFKKDLIPNVFYHVQPHVSISKLKQCISLTETLLINLEVEMVETLGIGSELTKERHSLRQQLHSAEYELKEAQAIKDRLEKSITSDQQLSTTRMNLNNLKSKVQKTEKALRDGKISQESFNTRVQEYQTKIDKLNTLICEVEQKTIEQIKKQKNDAVSKIKELAGFIKITQDKINSLPKTFEITDSLRANCSLM